MSLATKITKDRVPTQHQLKWSLGCKYVLFPIQARSCGICCGNSDTCTSAPSPVGQQLHHQCFEFIRPPNTIINSLLLLLLLIPLALQPTVGFGLSNNVLPFFPICHQLSTSSHSQHLKISFYFLFPSFPGSSPSRPFQFWSEDLCGHPILLHSL